MNYFKGFNDILKNIKILYVEDEIDIMEDIKELLECYCNNVIVASNGEEAYELYTKEKPNIILTDIKMPVMDGVTFIKKIREVDLKTAVIFLTALNSEEKLLEAANLNVQGYILKSKITSSELMGRLYHAIQYLDLSVNLSIKFSNDLFYDQLTGTFTYKETEQIKTNKKEKAFINLLLENKNKLVTYRIIENVVWNGYDEVMTGSALRTLVLALRKKLPINIIENISKEGYKINI